MVRGWPWLVALLLAASIAQSIEPIDGGAGTKEDAARSGKVVPTDFARLKAFDPNGGVGRRVVEIPVTDTIDLGLASFIERVFEQLSPTDIVVVRIKTFGGRVDAAVRVRDQLLSAKVPTIAYVDRRAISAGALITLSADLIIMSPGASIGAATPVQQQGGEMKPTSEKVVSYMRAEMRATAEAKGRRADIAEAMVDPDVEIEGVSEKGKLLTLTSEQAVELGLADAQLPSIAEVVDKLNLKQAKREFAGVNWGEKVARFLTDPAISSLLMTFGFIGLLMELYTPGFGVGGIIGITCLLLFFGGHYAAELAGWEEALLLLAGLVLLALEVLVIPGTSVAGIAGGLLICIGLVMAMMRIDLPFGVAFDLGYIQSALSRALVRLSIAVLSLIVAAVVFGKYLPKSRAASWMVFKMQPAAGDPAALGAEAHGGSLPEEYSELLGRVGQAATVLRPTGIAEFDGRRIHVLTQGEFVAVGSSVEVVRAEGHRVVVREVKEPDEGDKLEASAKES